MPHRQQLNRREFLKQAGGTFGRAALAAGGICSITQQQAWGKSYSELDRYDFLMPRVKFVEDRRAPDRWNVRPGGDANLLRRLSSVVRCKVKPISGTNNWEPQYAADDQFNAVVTFDEFKVISKYPFLFMTGENHFEFDDEQKNNLYSYIARGGFLLMDDCVVASGGDFFYKSAYQLLEEVFGRGAVKRIANEHEVFHNVYDLGDIGLPYMHGQNHGARGVFFGDRLAVFLASTDLHCGWTDGQGRHFPNHDQAVQMGINIIMYAISH